MRRFFWVSAGCIAMALVLVQVPQASAQQVDRYVWKDNGGAALPYDTWANAASNIQTAIDAAVAANGDQVLVADGVYDTGGYVWTVGANSLTNRIYINKAIVVRSTNNNPTNAIIKGFWDPVTTNGPSAVRCVLMASGATLMGFTITNGATLNAQDYRLECGGGVYAGNLGAIITNCIITGNAAYGDTPNGIGGGGVFVATVYDSRILNNWIKTKGGGGARGCNLYRCLLAGNSTETSGSWSQGAGMFAGYAVDCVFSNNVCAYYGGGLGGGGSAAYVARASGCTFYTNQATYGGGAYDSLLTNCTFMYNQSSGNGGGAAVSTLLNCTLISNRASSGGGAAYGGSLTNSEIAFNVGATGGGVCRPSRVQNCLIYGNQAYGGGAYLSDNNTMDSCTIAGNNSSGVLIEIGGHTAYLKSCVIASNSPNNWVINGGDLVFSNTCTVPSQGGWDASNVAADPLFLANGSGSGTSLVPGNYRLAGNSPCIDTGLYQTWMDGTLDMDGRRRIINGTPDMGCYEFEPQTTIFILR